MLQSGHKRWYKYIWIAKRIRTFFKIQGSDWDPDFFQNHTYFVGVLKYIKEQTLNSILNQAVTNQSAWGCKGINGSQVKTILTKNSENKLESAFLFVEAGGWDPMKYLIGFEVVQSKLLASLNVAWQLLVAVPSNNVIMSFRMCHRTPLPCAFKDACFR